VEEVSSRSDVKATSLLIARDQTVKKKHQIRICVRDSARPRAIIPGSSDLTAKTKESPEAHKKRSLPSANDGVFPVESYGQEARIKENK
jgi:hypothetical protein